MRRLFLLLLPLTATAGATPQEAERFIPFHGKVWDAALFPPKAVYTKEGAPLSERGDREWLCCFFTDWMVLEQHSRSYAGSSFFVFPDPGGGRPDPARCLKEPKSAHFKMERVYGVPTGVHDGRLFLDVGGVLESYLDVYDLKTTVRLSHIIDRGTEFSFARRSNELVSKASELSAEEIRGLKEVPKCRRRRTNEQGPQYFEKVVAERRIDLKDFSEVRKDPRCVIKFEE